MNTTRATVKETIYSCIDYWLISIYPSLFKGKEVPSQDDADNALIEFSSKFDGPLFSKIEETVGGEFKWESNENPERAIPDLDAGYIPIENFSSSLNGFEVNMKTRINLCLSPSTHTKITTIVELEKNVGIEEIKTLIPLAEEKARKNTMCFAEIYKEFAVEYEVAVDEKRPLYKVSLMSLGMDSKIAKDVIMSSKSSKKLSDLTRSNAQAIEILNNIKELEDNFIKTDSQEWRIKKLIDHEESNTVADGRHSIIGTYGIYELPRETSFLSFVFGGHTQTHAITRDIVLNFIRDL